ncbi:MAG: aspartate/glutamate racemase family protein [Eisenbergiella sp.]
MRENHDVEFVRKRWISYAETLEKLGVDAVLSACSTVGSFAEEADRMLSIPVYRIDEAMCEKAVESGRTISVFATLQSTLTPTVDLVRRKAKEAGKDVIVQTFLVEGIQCSDGRK